VTAGLYLMRAFLGRLLGVLLALAALMQLLDLLDNASSVLMRGGVLAILRYTALRLPTLLGQMLPVAALVAAALTFMRLTSTLELTALRALGVSIWRMMVALLPACALAAAVQFVLLDRIAPPTQRALSDWWAAHPAPGTRAAERPRQLWLRSQQDIVAVDRVSLDGTELEGVIIVARDPDGLATTRIDAAQAMHEEGRWTLRGVRIARPGGSAAETLASMPWPEGPSPRNMVEVARPTEAMSVSRAREILRGEWAGTRGAAYYEMRLQTSFAALLGPAIMVLLAAPAACGLPRRGGGGLRAGLGLALGLGYLTFAGLTAALGEAAVLPPAMAAWAPPVIFGCAGLAILLRMEEG
jgi:lipopolysaccharide export system permease protein